MFGDGLNLVNAGHVKRDILGFPNRICVLAGDHTQIGHRFTGVGLNLVPDFEFCFRGPNGNHIGARITRDHEQDLILGLGSGYALRHKGAGGRSQACGVKEVRNAKQNGAFGGFFG
jgi:hypothetical protein